jgi:hypothetical protein
MQLRTATSGPGGGCGGRRHERVNGKSGRARLAKEPLASVFLGFIIIWLVFDVTATGTASLHGEYGLLVGALVITTAAVFEVVISRVDPGEVLQRLGLGRPSLRGMVAGLVISLALVAVLAIVVGASLGQSTLRDKWPWLLVGLYANTASPRRRCSAGSCTAIYAPAAASHTPRCCRWFPSQPSTFCCWLSSRCRLRSARCSPR